jgi:hypothetical protein
MTALLLDVHTFDVLETGARASFRRGEELRRAEPLRR